jgi:uncharacterized protein YcfJ
MKKLAFLSIIFLLSACAGRGVGGYDPVVDPKSVRDASEYDRDAAECRALASENTDTARSIAESGVISAAIGGGVGALLGLIFGDTVEGLASGAVIGGVSGGVQGASASGQNYEAIFKNCLRGRGYSVLN